MKGNDLSVQAVRPEQDLRAAVLPVNVRYSEVQRPTGTTARAVSMIIKKAVLAGREKVSGRNARSVQAVRPEQDLRAAVLPVNVRYSEVQRPTGTTARAVSTIIKKAVPKGREDRRDLSGKIPGRDSRLKKVYRSRRTGAGLPKAGRRISGRNRG